LIRLSVRFVSALALGALSLSVFQVAAQQDVSAAPAQEPAASAPSAPAPAAAPVFPKPDPANFTAATPSKETVGAFLQTNWGFDDSRIWQVQAILKTQVEGVSRVLVMVADKAGKQKAGQLEFFVLPGGKYIMVVGDDNLVPFGEHPYADARAALQQRADGPYRGSAMKDFEIVEFADFQCPHCKDAQANMDKLAVDFPKARIIFQIFPLESIHPQSRISAAYGICVAKQGGSDAFFTFAAAVFDGQDGLATPDGATLTLNSAVTKAALDPAKIAACASTPATLAAVAASKKLAEDLNINQTPMLAVNGRMIPATIPYDTIKQIIQYQAKLDGVGN
jgi:protein-disulfide isomerase